MKSPEMYLECVSCGKTYDPWDLRYKCDCGGILDVKRASGATASSSCPSRTR